jgi:hypothetical protein
VVNEIKTVLMSSNNPDGWKLEDLLVTLINELEEKTRKVEKDTSTLSKTIQNNNLQIIGLLVQARAIQEQTYNLLNAKAPDEGATGNPRIG